MRWLAWVHPVGGLITIALAVWVASLAVRARRGGPTAAAARAQHAALMPWVYALTAASWSVGLASVTWLRDDLERGASGHFTVGSLIVLLFTAAAVVSRFIGSSPRARAVHPWIGAAALLLSGVQVFLGLQIMPR